MARRRKDDVRRDADGAPVSGTIHQCGNCGKEEPWGPTWSWYGSYREFDDGLPIFKACSPECMARMEEAKARDRIAANLEAAKADEDRLENELRHKRAMRLQIEHKLAAIPPRPGE